MSTVCLEVSENAPPVCLFAENPNRLVSLLEMLRFNAHSFVAAFNTLGQLSMELKSGRTIPSDESFSRVGASLGLLHRECENLGLKFALVHLNRLMQTIAAGPSFRELQDGVDVTAQRIWDELDQRTYLQIDSGNLDLYNPQSPPFGQKVADSFPGAIDDVLEAGNCLALERPTAAVFHLMRVMEAALKAVAKDWAFPTLRVGSHTSGNLPKLSRVIGSLFHRT